MDEAQRLVEELQSLGFQVALKDGRPAIAPASQLSVHHRKQVRRLAEEMRQFLMSATGQAGQPVDDEELSQVVENLGASGPGWVVLRLERVGGLRIVVSRESPPVDLPSQVLHLPRFTPAELNGLATVDDPDAARRLIRAVVHLKTAGIEDGWTIRDVRKRVQPNRPPSSTAL